jgi:hypothetical protein
MTLFSSGRFLLCGAVLGFLWLAVPVPVAAADAEVASGDAPVETGSDRQEEETGESPEGSPEGKSNGDSGEAPEDEEEEEIPEDVDDTPEGDTESTIDDVEAKRGFGISGDLRPTIEYFDRDNRNGTEIDDERAGFRLRLETVVGLAKWLRLGTRVAGRCFTNDCDLEWVMETASPQTNGLAPGQFTLDELFLHWHRRKRFDIAIGRLQTRFVLRGGVYAKSLDRNDSNNVNVTWTDGLHSTYRAKNGWASHLVLQYNDEDGTGSIRRGPLDFDADKAEVTYFLGFENRKGWRNIVQRAFDVSYLPDSLLKDGTKAGRRVDYWGFVARLAGRWPNRIDKPRLRAGIEIGYAPETATGAAVNLPDPGDADGLAWDVVASIMEFVPNHSIGINYAQIGAGWYLSPQFRPNDELFEIRYQWSPPRFPLLEARWRWREELEQEIGALQKRKEFDFYLRLTWRFNLKKY